MEKMQEIPNKLYFRIGEVSDLVGVRPYVLRYWETEFPEIKPMKSKSGQRLYKRKDVESLVRIKELLYGERFTIDGARKRLKDVLKVERKAHEGDVQDSDDPVQLEVFGEEETVPIVEKRIASTKIFIKLKKDLESLLQMVKS